MKSTRVPLFVSTTVNRKTEHWLALVFSIHCICHHHLTPSNLQWNGMNNLSRFGAKVRENGINFWLFDTLHETDHIKYFHLRHWLYRGMTPLAGVSVSALWLCPVMVAGVTLSTRPLVTCYHTWRPHPSLTSQPAILYLGQDRQCHQSSSRCYLFNSFFLQTNF